MNLKQRFKELYEASGWSQAEMARHLEMTRAGVNGIVTGEVNPSAGTVKMLEMILLQAGKLIPPRDMGETAKAHVDEIEAKSGEIDSLVDKIMDLREASPEKFNSVKHVVESMHRLIGPETSYRKPGRRIGGVSSKVASVAAASQSAASAEALKLSQSSPLKPATGAPNVRKPSPKRGADRGTYHPPGSAKPVQE